MAETRPVTRICRHDAKAIHIREHDLVEELIGGVGFTEMIYLQCMGRRPNAGEVAILDAVLVTLMEHGMTPSTVVSRLIYDSAPEALQGAVAGGLLTVGSTFVGTMEGCARLLAEMLAAADGPDAAGRRIAEAHRRARTPVPGFGHPIHTPDDPRSPKLFAVAEAQGVEGRHIAALHTLSAAVDDVYNRHLTINATGAIAALLSEIGVPSDIMRGFALITRAAGIVGHLLEEQQMPAARAIWHAADAAVPYAAAPDP